MGVVILKKHFRIPFSRALDEVRGELGESVSRSMEEACWDVHKGSDSHLCIYESCVDAERMRRASALCLIRISADMWCKVVYREGEGVLKEYVTESELAAEAEFVLDALAGTGREGGEQLTARRTPPRRAP